MLLLTSPTDFLELQTGIGASTDWTCSWVDVNFAASSFVPGSAEGNVAASIATVIAAPPAVGLQRQIKYLSVVNRDLTLTQTVTIDKNSGAQFNVTGHLPLAPGDSLQYVDSRGFFVLNAQGFEKFIGATGPAGGTGATGPPGQGPPGTDGTDGEDLFVFQGPPGPQGPQGIPGTGGGSASSGFEILFHEMQPEEQWPQGQNTQAAAATPSAAANITPDTHPSIPTANDDEFESGTSIDLTGARRAGATAWTWANQGTATALVSEGSMVLTGQNVAGISHNIVSQPVAGATWAYTCKMSAANYAGTSEAGMVVLNGTGGFLTFNIYTNSGSAAFVIQSFNSPTSFAGGTLVGSGTVPGGGAYMSPGYLQIAFDGTNLIFSFSPSGVPGTFATVLSQAAASFLGTPTRIGLNIDSTGSGNLTAAFDWFRKTA